LATMRFRYRSHFRSPLAASVGGARVELITKTLPQKIDKKATAISFDLAGIPAKQALTKSVIDAVQAYLLALPVVSGSGNRTGALHDGYQTIPRLVDPETDAH
jgi:hypothetical protein